MDQIARRDLLIAGAGLAGAFAPGLAAAAPLAPTPPNDLGPFYKRGASSAAVLRRPGDAGLPLALAGTVFRATGERLPAARVELWHSDDAGDYDMAGIRFRADLKADDKAGYAVATVMPGHYPGRVCQHVHFIVRAEGCKPLVTQLYFATDPVFEGDPDKHYGRDPLLVSRELIRPVSLVAKDGATSAHCLFDLVLEAL
jgi:protocatechuate 3,4-dioxygenase beta subunit